MPGYANLQNLNRFSYVVNNPLRYTDPTGHRYIEDGFEGSLKSVEEKMNQKWKTKLEKIKEKSNEKNGPQNDKKPNIIRLRGVWQPENNQTLNPLGKAAILAFGAIAIAETVSIGAEAVPVNPILGGAILAVGIYGALTWWNIAQTPTR